MRHNILVGGSSMVEVFYEFYGLHSDHIHTIILWTLLRRLGEIG